MRVIIAGSRDGCAQRHLAEAIESSGFPITEIVTGGARGVDTQAFDWGWTAGIPVKTFLADWKTNGKAAGPIRNRQMAEYAEALIALPGGRGTANMIEEATKRGLRVYIA